MKQSAGYLDSLYSAMTTRMDTMDKDGLKKRIRQAKRFQMMDYILSFHLTDGEMQRKSIKIESGFSFVATQANISFSGTLETPPKVGLGEAISSRNLISSLDGYYLQSPPEPLAHSYSLAGPGVMFNSSGDSNPWSPPGEIYLPLQPNSFLEVSAKRHKDSVLNTIVHVVVTGWKITELN